MKPNNSPNDRSDLLKLSLEAIQLDLEDLKIWKGIVNQADPFVRLNIRLLKFSINMDIEIRKTLEKVPDFIF